MEFLELSTIVLPIEPVIHSGLDLNTRLVPIAGTTVAGGVNVTGDTTEQVPIVMVVLAKELPHTQLLAKPAVMSPDMVALPLIKNYILIIHLEPEGYKSPMMSMVPIVSIFISKPGARTSKNGKIRNM